MDRVSLSVFLKALDKAIESPVMALVAEALTKCERIVSHDELIVEVWSTSKEPETASSLINVMIYRLRKKGLRIETHRWRGYIHHRETR